MVRKDGLLLLRDLFSLNCDEDGFEETTSHKVVVFRHWSLHNHCGSLEGLAANITSNMCQYSGMQVIAGGASQALSSCDRSPALAQILSSVCPPGRLFWECVQPLAFTDFDFCSPTWLSLLGMHSATGIHRFWLLFTHLAVSFGSVFSHWHSELLCLVSFGMGLESLSLLCYQ